MCYTKIVFNDEASIKYLIDKMASGRQARRLADAITWRKTARWKQIQHYHPTSSSRWPDNLHSKIPMGPLTIVYILNYGACSTNFGACSWLIANGLGVKPTNILIPSGTGSGKTKTLNCASAFVPERERNLDRRHR